MRLSCGPRKRRVVDVSTGGERIFVVEVKLAVKLADDGQALLLPMQKARIIVLQRRIERQGSVEGDAA